MSPNVIWCAQCRTKRWRVAGGRAWPTTVTREAQRISLSSLTVRSRCTPPSNPPFAPSVDSNISKS
jgi:hypothetical protein